MSTQRPAITTLFYNWKSSVQQMMTVVHLYKLIPCNNKEYIPDICDNAATLKNILLSKWHQKQRVHTIWFILYKILIRNGRNFVSGCLGLEVVSWFTKRAQDNILGNRNVPNLYYGGDYTSVYTLRDNYTDAYP